MKPCITCHEKPTKNGIYKAHLEHFVEKQLPKTNTHYHNKDGFKFHMNNLKPDTCIFYFSTLHRDFTKSIQMREKAYGKLENSGVSKTNSDGKVTFYLECPQLYMNDDGKVYSRHVHFLYWNSKSLDWNMNLYTTEILCEVDKEYIVKQMKKKDVILVDARKEDVFLKKHMTGAISLPYDKKWNEETVLEEISNVYKKYDGNKLIPIIIYCEKKCKKGYLVFKRLNKLGFYNTMHYENCSADF